jgi:hypothetical protein
MKSLQAKVNIADRLHQVAARERLWPRWFFTPEIICLIPQEIMSFLCRLDCQRCATISAMEMHRFSPP